MHPKDIRKAIYETERLLKGSPPESKALAFPIIFDRLLGVKPDDSSMEQPRTRTKSRASSRDKLKTKLTRPELVRIMVRAGWFKKKRRLGEIARELRRRAMKTPLTSLPALLLPMVLEGVLEREHDAKGLYVYFSK